MKLSLFKFLVSILLCTTLQVNSQNYDKVWLRYWPLEERVEVAQYKNYLARVSVFGDSEIMQSTTAELELGLEGMLDLQPEFSDEVVDNSLIIGTLDEIPSHILELDSQKRDALNAEGYVLIKTANHLVVTAKEDVGLLYGTFHLLRFLQIGKPLESLDLQESPQIKLRLLNHWDNPGNVPEGREPIERGYAGGSIFKWNELPQTNERYRDYARLLASVGINGAAINNVNTAKHGLEGWKLLTPEYLPKLTALAETFRGYGVKLYISVNYFSPIIIGELPDADPLNPEVQRWWEEKVDEIYKEIPDFGGFLLKADSEGEPGPMKYGRDHAQGAEVLANALEPYGGILMWRAFVYSGSNEELSTDRAYQAYQIFEPLDGKFPDNSLVQIKNGPIDFQVREPVSPLFGQMPSTNQLLELQITQEYTGWDKHVCYLLPQWKNILDFDTHVKGPGSTVAKVIDGSLFDYPYSGVAGVSNIGDDYNWTGHYLAQANFYGFGRLIWNPQLTTQEITSEWIIQTFGKDSLVQEVISEILLTSWETYEDYTSPLGVGLMTDADHFYPAPEFRVPFHKADQDGVGYDRTMATGSGYTGQYAEPMRSTYENIETCPDELLLFFHHVPYEHELNSGKTVIQHIYDTHNEGVDKTKDYVKMWESLKGRVDAKRFSHVRNKLYDQVQYAEEWRDSINAYFRNLSGIPDRNSPEFKR